jgi:hypothetical protein
MHCIVPFAAPASEAGRGALAALQWPVLTALLARLALLERDEGEATSFSPPHERVLARVLAGAPGEPGATGADAAAADGRLPLAAHWARADGVAVGEAAWGLVSPVHWLVGTDQVSLADPQQLQLDEPASRAFFEAVRPLVEDDVAAGESTWQRPQWFFGHASRWYLSHESLAGLRSASLDRVAGRNVDPWLVHEGATAAETRALRRWRRLQAEVQMLLHAHPLNAEREARGLPVVNSFWLSGCGRALAGGHAGDQAGAAPHVELTLRAAALAEDWGAWAAGWRRIEAGVLRELEATLARGDDVRLTLAGERAAVTFGRAARGLLARMKGLLSRPSVPELLASL